MSLLHAKREVADNSFPKRTFEDVKLEVKAGFEGNRLVVTLTNQNIPHWVPTADNGDPRMYLYITYFNAAGEEIDDYKEILAPQQDTALPFKKPVTYRYRFRKELKTAEIVVSYKPAWSKEKSEVHRLQITR